MFYAIGLAIRIVVIMAIILLFGWLIVLLGSTIWDARCNVLPVLCGPVGAPPTAAAPTAVPTTAPQPTVVPTAVPAAPTQVPPQATTAPTNTAVPATTPVVPTGSGSCSDNGVTALSSRESLVVNGVATSVQVRDPNCKRALFHTETGVAQGANFKLVVPKGWSMGISAVSCQVAQDGKKPVDFTGGPFLVIRGPWNGSIGCFEAGLHGLPTEWEQNVLIEQILPIHRKETGKPTDQPIILP